MRDLNGLPEVVLGLYTHTTPHHGTSTTPGLSKTNVNDFDAGEVGKTRKGTTGFDKAACWCRWEESSWLWDGVEARLDGREWFQTVQLLRQIYS